MEENGATAEQLAALREGCEAAKHTVKEAAMQASEAIKDALPDRPESDGTEGDE